MNIQLRLNLEQVVIAIQLLSQDEKRVLQQHLPQLLNSNDISDDLDRFGWLKASESAFDFWNAPSEDIYNDLIPEIEGTRQ